MASLFVAALILFDRRSRATPIDRGNRAHGTCQSFMMPVTVATEGGIYDVPPVNNDIDATAYAIYSDTWSSPKGAQAVVQNVTIAGTYNIHAQLCIPKLSDASSNKADILQIATHGLHYDGRYWDAELDGGAYSYVEAALGAGYSILTYDRLGMGESDKPDAYSDVQAPVQLEILHQITLMARNGSLYDVAKRTKFASSAFDQLATPSRVVHVGHSFGSVLTSAYISKHGPLSDAAIITGFIPNSKLGTIGSVSFNLEYAATSSPKFSDRSSGYTVADKQGIQTVFFGGDTATAFTKEMLDYGDEIKQPLTVGEYTSAFTVAQAALGSPDFRGPLQYLIPEFDFYICAGDCKNTYNVSTVNQMWPNANPFEVRMQPNTGHALPLHNNATAGFQVMFDFLSANGL